MSNNNHFRRRDFSNRTNETPRYHDTWDHLTPPASPGRREMNMNSNAYSYGEYGHWSYERDDSSKPQRNYENNRVMPSHQDDQRWSRPPPSRDVYDPFEPLPVTLPVYNPDRERDRYMSGEQHTSPKRKRSIDRPEDFRAMSNYLLQEESRTQYSYPTKESSAAYPYHHTEPSEKQNQRLAFQPPKSRKKRPKGMPKRPLSAYNLFFQSERMRIIAESSKPAPSTSIQDSGKDKDSEINVEVPVAVVSTEGDKNNDINTKKSKSKRTPHGKISFEKLGRLIGARWKELPEEEKKQYQDKAVKESERYSREMEEYHNKDVEKQKKKMTEDSIEVKNHSEKEKKSLPNKIRSSSISTNDKNNSNITPETSKSENLDDKGKSDTGKKEDKNHPFFTWRTVPPSQWNKDIRVTVNDSEGKPKEYFLAYAAVRMTRECAMNYISTLSNVVPLDDDTVQNDEETSSSTPSSDKKENLDSPKPSKV